MRGQCIGIAVGRRYDRESRVLKSQTETTGSGEEINSPRTWCGSQPLPHLVHIAGVGSLRVGHETHTGAPYIGYLARRGGTRHNPPSLYVPTRRHPLGYQRNYLARILPVRSAVDKY